jgi:hypothetical protein
MADFAPGSPNVALFHQQNSIKSQMSKWISIL